MFLCGGPREPPNLLKPVGKATFLNHAQLALPFGWFPIPTRLPLHENELDIVLYYRVRFIGLAQEPRSVIDFKARVSDLIPNDRGEVVEPMLSAMHDDVGVERNYNMTSVLFP